MDLYVIWRDILGCDDEFIVFHSPNLSEVEAKYKELTSEPLKICTSDNGCIIDKLGVDEEDMGVTKISLPSDVTKIYFSYILEYDELFYYNPFIILYYFDADEMFDDINLLFFMPGPGNTHRIDEELCDICGASGPISNECKASMINELKRDNEAEFDVDGYAYHIYLKELSLYT